MGVLYSNEAMEQEIVYKTTAAETMAHMTGNEKLTENSIIDNSPVDQYLSILQDNIYALRATVIDLVHRLEPVLSPVGEEPAPKTALPPTTCRLSVVLNKFVFEVQSIDEVVQSTRRHLQL